MAFELCDLPGRLAFREAWAKHIKGAGGVVFAVDASDTMRLPVAEEVRRPTDRYLQDRSKIVCADFGTILAGVAEAFGYTVAGSGSRAGNEA